MTATLEPSGDPVANSSCHSGTWRVVTAPPSRSIRTSRDAYQASSAGESVTMATTRIPAQPVGLPRVHAGGRDLSRVAGPEVHDPCRAPLVVTGCRLDDRRPGRLVGSIRGEVAHGPRAHPVGLLGVLTRDDEEQARAVRARPLELWKAVGRGEPQRLACRPVAADVHRERRRPVAAADVREEGEPPPAERPARICRVDACAGQLPPPAAVDRDHVQLGVAAPLERVGDLEDRRHQAAVRRHLRRGRPSTSTRRAGRRGPGSGRPSRRSAPCRVSWRSCILLDGSIRGAASGFRPILR